MTTSRSTLRDAVNLLAHLFQGRDAPDCSDAADTDDNGQLNLTDAIFLLRFLFQGGDEPPAPGLECGTDTTDDRLADCSSTGC